jgi:hypothetical protein
MMRHKTSWAAFTLCVILVSQCFGQNRLIESEGFSLRVPEAWEQLEEDKTIITARSPRRGDEDRFRENVRLHLYDVGKAYTPEQVVARQKTDLGRFKLIGEGKVGNAQVPMRWMAIAPKVPRSDSDRLVKIDFITTNGTVIVVLIAMAEMDDWKDHMPLFEKIAGTLTLPSSRAPLQNGEPDVR